MSRSASWLLLGLLACDAPPVGDSDTSGGGVDRDPVDTSETGVDSADSATDSADTTETGLDSSDSADSADSGDTADSSGDSGPDTSETGLETGVDTGLDSGDSGGDSGIIPGLVGDTCEGAPLLIDHVGQISLYDQTMTGFEDDYRDGATCAFTDEPDRAWRVLIPRNCELRASATTPAGSLSLNLVAGDAGSCAQGASTSCVGLQDENFTTEPQVEYATARSGTGQEGFLVLDGYADAIELDVEILKLPEEADLCDDAEPAVPMTSALGDTTEYLHDYGGGSECMGLWGPDKVYEILVPFNHVLQVTLTPEPGFDGALLLMRADTCNGLEPCLHSVDDGGPGAVEILQWPNDVSRDIRMHVVVDGKSTGGAYSVMFETFART